MLTPLPNPDTYLNHFPPALVTQFEAARDLAVVVLGAMIWDILLYIPDDIKILRRSSFCLVTVCFVTSRLFALTFILVVVIEFTHPVDHCNAINYCTGIGRLHQRRSCFFNVSEQFILEIDGCK